MTYSNSTFTIFKVHPCIVKVVCTTCTVFRVHSINIRSVHLYSQSRMIDFCRLQSAHTQSSKYAHVLRKSFNVHMPYSNSTFTIFKVHPCIVTVVCMTCTVFRVHNIYIQSVHLYCQSRMIDFCRLQSAQAQSSKYAHVLRKSFNVHMTYSNSTIRIFTVHPCILKVVYYKCTVFKVHNVNVQSAASKRHMTCYR
jgi:hypothetical protein